MLNQNEEEEFNLERTPVNDGNQHTALYSYQREELKIIYSN